MKTRTMERMPNSKTYNQSDQGHRCTKEKASNLP